MIKCNRFFIWKAGICLIQCWLPPYFFLDGSLLPWQHHLFDLDNTVHQAISHLALVVKDLLFWGKPKTWFMLWLCFVFVYIFWILLIIGTGDSQVHWEEVIFSVSIFLESHLFASNSNLFLSFLPSWLCAADCKYVNRSQKRYTNTHNIKTCILVKSKWT